MRLILLLLFLTLSSAPAVSQTTSIDSVKQVVDAMFTFMKNADSAAMSSLFTADAQLQTVVVSKEGVTSVRSQRIQEFITMVGQLPKGDADERIRFDAVHIDGALASVWTPYQFYYKGNFSHCGVNSFQLVRIKGAWKIHFIIDTRRKAGCD